MACKAANLRLFAVPLAATMLSPSASSADDQQDKIFATSQRLRKGFAFAELKAGKPRADKVECYRPKEYYGRFGRDGYPVARVVSVEIDAGKDAVMAAWMDAERRQGWDPNVHRIIMRPSPDGPVTQTYARSPLPYLVPARDYCTRTFHSSGALIGVDDFTASAVVHVDAADACPASWLSLYVRGRLNAILLLQPLAPARTRATYVVESDPGGWGFLAPAVANVFHGDAAALTLAGLKRAAERVDAGEEDGLTVEQVARRRFAKRLEDEERQRRGTSIVEDAGAPREDVQATVALLEAKLTSLRQTERAERLDLSALKAQVEKDLERARRTLREATK